LAIVIGAAAVIIRRRGRCACVGRGAGDG
jgi:hypothetical protein